MIAWLDSSQPRSSRFILLDRDGVLNANRPDYVKSSREMRFYPDALDAVKLLNEYGVDVVITSNQSGLNRGIIGWNDFWEMHGAMVQAVEGAGGRILAAFYCPHRPDEGCSCRKPAPGMIRAACDLYRFAPRDAFLVGDSLSDLEAAENAGCTPVFLDRECVGGAGLPHVTAPAGSRCYSGAWPGGHYHTLLDAVRGLFGA
jgi:D-glycero-D-manno-heptose 1,7-bisphosphate phosphatase